MVITYKKLQINYCFVWLFYVPQTETILKFILIPTLGKGSNSHFPKCSIIPKNHNLLFMFLPLNRKILTGLRHLWLIHKIKLLFLADTKNYFKLRFGVRPPDFMSPNAVLILNSWISQYHAEERQKICDCNFQSCLHFSFSWRCTSHCNHTSNSRHLNVKILQPVFLTSVYSNTDPSKMPSHRWFQVWGFFPHVDAFFLVPEILTTKPSHHDLFLFWLGCDFNIKKTN